ncbi:AMP deaminase, putative / myoadenylate deaminase [Artemisia annua]|uniref:AMP deaminase, putative / myoadenylate deaminase n=1 Tax=Artemisia annua TaxID=35608 RepID=A0A2U1MYH1_ARTAN|nr:AMP deaminase, putative / myoadenylate deaminase [Artemisia annua]
MNMLGFQSWKICLIQYARTCSDALEMNGNITFKWDIISWSLDDYIPYLHESRHEHAMRTVMGYARCNITACGPDKWFYLDGSNIDDGLSAIVPDIAASNILGKSTSHTGLVNRASLRPTSPKSLVASASAFESVEESDEDVYVNENENANLDSGYLHTNGNVVQNANVNGEQLPIAAAALMRSHSVLVIFMVYNLTRAGNFCTPKDYTIWYSFLLTNSSMCLHL